MTVRTHHAVGSGKCGSFYVVFPEKAVELSFDVGSSGVQTWTKEDFPTDLETFVQGLVVMVVEETAGGNLYAATKAAGLLADYYDRDVLVLDAQFNLGDMLIGEMHFVDGETVEDRRARAQELLELCLNPGKTQVLH
ncbi:MAG: hypothetical protein EP347_06670 [Alphaproteobacteria bacterium]|nr:MAG: hypothetical protein EP347_06670 [Alphaproteobacteria bacterium]